MITLHWHAKSEARILVLVLVLVLVLDVRARSDPKTRGVVRRVTLQWKIPYSVPILTYTSQHSSSLYARTRTRTMGGKQPFLRVRPRKDMSIGPCTLELSAMLACWATSADLHNAGPCKDLGSAVTECMRRSVSCVCVWKEGGSNGVLTLFLYLWLAISPLHTISLFPHVHTHHTHFFPLYTTPALALPLTPTRFHFVATRIGALALALAHPHTRTLASLMCSCARAARQAGPKVAKKSTINYHLGKWSKKI